MDFLSQLLPLLLLLDNSSQPSGFNIEETVTSDVAKDLQMTTFVSPCLSLIEVSRKLDSLS
jgi:hypothetical protein